MKIVQLTLYMIFTLGTFPGCIEENVEEPDSIDFFFDRNDLTTHYNITSIVSLDSSSVFFSGFDNNLNSSIYLLNIDTEDISPVDMGEFKSLDSTLTELYYSENYRIWKGKDLILRYNNNATNNDHWRIGDLWRISDMRSTGSSQIKCDYEGNIWVAEQPEKGLRMFDGQEWHDYFENEVIMYVCIDRNNNIYASTLPVEGSGILLRYDHLKWDTIYTCRPDRLWVSCMDIDNFGNLYFGILSRDHVGINHGGGIIKYDGVSFEKYTIQNSELPSNSVVDIFVNKNNSIWIGTYNGGYIYRNQNNTWENYSDIDLINNNIEHIIESDEEKVYFSIQWFGIGSMKI